MWGGLVQLQSTDTAATLDEAKAALERAVELGEDSPEAWKELGHFLSAVEDDAPGASRCFDKAVGLCKVRWPKRFWPRPIPFSDTGAPDEALACLAEAYWLRARNGKPTEAGAEILDRLKDLARTE